MNEHFIRFYVQYIFIIPFSILPAIQCNVKVVKEKESRKVSSPQDEFLKRKANG